MKNLICVTISLLFLLFISCKKDKEEINTLTVSKQKIEIPADGGSASFTIETDAPEWNIENPATDWLTVPVTSGSNKETTITVQVDSRTLEYRADTLTVIAGNAPNVNVVVTQASSEYLYDLTASETLFEFNKENNTALIKVTSTASEWHLINVPDWIKFKLTSGATGEFDIDPWILENETGEDRSATVLLQAENAPTVELSFSQLAGIYPNYNTAPLDPDMTGMNSSSVELAGKIKVGWNIGNTLEASGGETAWGNPAVTKDLINLVKANGFNAIRIPCSWNQYLEDEATAKIKTSWLDRVKEVVGYCIDNDMYVILNIHWDGGWLENNCTTEKKDEVNAKLKAFWEQIATHMRDFDEHLIFAGANEPDVDNTTKMNVLLSYYQTFIDAVRSTGGKNSYRVLVVQGPKTDIEKTENLMTTMPTDEIDGKMMAEIHYYTPYQFCLMTENADWGNMFYYWGNGYHSTTDTEHNATWGEEADLNDLLQQMKAKFVDHGIPVILGEYAVIKRTELAGDNYDLHLAARAYFLKYLTKQAKANGIIPFYWDAGNMGENSSALFNRQDNTVYDQQALDAIMDGAGE